MLYRKLPKTGDEWSILGFGAMRLPTKRGGIDEPRASAQIRSAIDRGVSYVDTALPYHGGASETFLGKLLSQDGLRDRVTLATKLPPWSVKQPQDLEEVLDAQLDKLRTDHIDVYLLHALDRRYWRKMQRLGALPFLDRAKQSGKVARVGFSFHGDRDTYMSILDAYDWDVVQLQWNYMDEQNQAGTEGLEAAVERQLGVIVMEPLRGGKLAGKVPKTVQAVWDEAPVRRPPAEWALRWVWNHPGVVTVLSGMNEESHIDENIRAADGAEPGSLTDEELEAVARARDAYVALAATGCTGCRYCVPCEEGVDIPMCFHVYDAYKMFGGLEMKFSYPIRLGGPQGETGYASQCTECGKCVRKCPQELPIPELLKDVRRELEGPLTRPMVWAFAKFGEVQRWTTLRRARKARRSDHG